MKKYILIILIFFSLKIIGQERKYNLKVTYKMETYFSGLTTYESTLFSNGSEAIFKYKNLDKDDTIDNGDNNFILKIIDSTIYYVQSSKSKDSLVELKKGMKKGKFYIIKESFPKIDWKITSDTTKVNNYICYKAKAKFRGREYTAWFTPDIVSNFGPWKLHGLPGVVLMAYDSKKEVFFTAEKIQTINKPVVAIKTDHYDRITRQEYKKILKQGIEELGEKFSSKAERGFTIKVSTSSIKTIEID